MAVHGVVLAAEFGGEGERDLAGARVVTGTIDGVSDKLTEVPSEHGLVVAWLLESSVLVCQEDVVQPSCEVRGCVCAEEEQTELGCGFEDQQGQSLCLASRPCLMR